MRIRSDFQAMIVISMVWAFIWVIFYFFAPRVHQ